MRVYLCGDQPDGQFADQLLAIGDGKFSTDVIQLPETMGTFVSNVDKSVSRIYPDLILTYYKHHMDIRLIVMVIVLNY